MSQTSNNPASGPGPAASDAAELAQEALRTAEAAVEKLQSTVGDGAPAPFQPQPLSRPASGTVPAGIDLLSDVNLSVKIELGRTRMLVEDVLRLSEGAVVELDKLAGDPVDVFVNDRHIARGEVLVLNDNFCVRINEILTGPDNGSAGRRSAR